MAQTPAIFVQKGESVDYTPTADTVAGTVVVEGSRVGITKVDIAALCLGALWLCGLFRAPKDSSDITAKGVNLYWDADGNPVGGTAGSGALTTTATGNTYAGKSEEVAGVAAETVLLRLGSMDQTATIDMDHLSDVGTVAHGAGAIIVGDGAKFEEVVLSGPFTLSAAGALRLAVASVAAAGANQGAAAAVAEGFTAVTAADDAKGVKLPAAAAGKFCILKNTVANKVLKVYPNTDDAINALAANASLDIAAATSVILIALDATTWYSVPLLPS
jgi:predicted RecA/RadA family phage recombinase